MALRKSGSNFIGDCQSDIPEALKKYSQDGYLAEHFQDAICTCGHRLFRLMVDDNEGAAIRICESCEKEHPIGDSADYLEDAELEECECPCGNGIFEITAGVALYTDSEAVRWLYLGCRCPKCGLTACYADWKNEFEGYLDFLKMI
jgi:hypothetical protein